MLLAFLAGAVIFTWLVVRSVRAGYALVVFWVPYLVFVLWVALSVEPPVTLWGKLVANLWVASPFYLPVLWAVAVRRHRLRRNK